MNDKIDLPLSRREFLKASGALIVSATAGATVVEAYAAAPGKPALVPEELDSWVAVLKDGRVAAFFGKVDYLGPVTTTRFGRRLATYQLYLGHGYHGVAPKP